MLGIQYNQWKQICESYQNANTRRKEDYLQLYPFSKITAAEWNKLKSQDFFDNYIDNGSFVNFPDVMFHASHYIQKDDGSFRDAELLSPVLFLILQALGKELSDLFSDKRPDNNSVYYSGNFDEGCLFYKSEYDKFYKELNESIELYQYFIKTDITSFFSNINANKLMRKLDERINCVDSVLSPIQLNTVKEFLTYCGAGGFPLVESSVTSSFLATKVYLERVDSQLTDFIERMIHCVDGVKLVRFVDDLYILLRCPDRCSFSDIHEASIEIRNKYSSLLKEEGLALNTKKYSFGESRRICDELKKSLYDEHYNETVTKIEDFFPDAIKSFLEAILEKLEDDCIDSDQYNDMIRKHFSRDDIEFTPEEVYNHLVYGTDCTQDDEYVAETIARIARKDVSVISLDSKRLIPLLINVKSDNAIKMVLNRLFERHRNAIWNSNDTTIAISYLLHSGFRHIDLLKVIRDEASELYRYYYWYCVVPNLMFGQEHLLRCLAIHDDWVANYLYFMYIARNDSANPFEAFAFYKSFFDRITVDIAYRMGIEKKKSRYEKYYKEENLKDFYSSVRGSGDTIEKAHKLRNMNPINHSSSGTVEKPERMKELSLCAQELESLIDQYLKMNSAGLMQ